MKESVTITIILFVFISVLLSGVYLNNQNTKIGFNSKIASTHRLGVVLLKVDDDWIYEKDGKKLIKIGYFEKKGLNISHDWDYEGLSPKSMACSNSSIEVIDEAFRRNKRKIDTFEIPIENNCLWIDLYITILDVYNEKTKEIDSSLYTNRRLYVYHPSKNKWWGTYPESGSVEVLLKMMYDDLYKQTNTKDEIGSLLSKLDTNDNKLHRLIIDKRTFNLPSMKFYEEKFGELIDKHHLFSWYVEKEEIGPKDEEE